MSRHVNVSPRAFRDLRRILGWLKKSSPVGAGRWYKAFWAKAIAIAEDPQQFGIASESEVLTESVREAFFKTPRGRYYQIIFDFAETEVYILRVRRPGDRPLRNRDVS